MRSRREGVSLTDPVRLRLCKCVGVWDAPNSGRFNSDLKGLLVPNQLLCLQVHLRVAALVGAGWTLRLLARVRPLVP